MKLTHFTIIFLAAFYWLITLIYTSPNNYIRIRSHTTNNFVEKYFYQKWNFFAPPADFDHRLYFTYYSKDSSKVASFEVLENILYKKRANAPFNFKEQYIDYLISGFINLLNDDFVAFLKLKEVDTVYSSKVKTTNEKFIDYEQYLIETNSPIYKLLTLLLKNYKLFVNAEKEITYGKLTVTHVELPSFEKRSLLIDTTQKRAESIAFISSLIKI